MEKTSYKYEVINNTLQDASEGFSVTVLCELAGYPALVITLG